MHNNITVIDQAVGRLQVQMEELTARMDAMEPDDCEKERDALINRCYNDGFKDGEKERLDKGITDNPDYIPVDLDGVWKVSSTTMNLLYAMYLWAQEYRIDNEDDWDQWIKTNGLKIGDTAVYRKGYADAVQEVINHVKNFGE